jgi:hypothetical protein
MTKHPSAKPQFDIDNIIATTKDPQLRARCINHRAKTLLLMMRAQRFLNTPKVRKLLREAKDRTNDQTTT